MQSVIVLSSDLQMICVSLQKELLYKTKRQPTHVEQTKFVWVFEVPVCHFFFNHSDSCEDSEIIFIKKITYNKTNKVH